jgi:hypothetical protein
MVIGRLRFLFAVIAASLCAQTDVPSFTRESVLPAWGKHAQSLMPGDLVAIYGRHLAPPDGCPPPPPPPKDAIYPTEICGTHVTVDGAAAGLLAVLENQINLKIPAGVPTSGEAAIVITVRGVNGQPVMVPFGKPKVVLSITSPAYVHMPVWIALDRPYPYYETLYPYSLIPENFGGGRFEVKLNGVMLKPLENRRGGAQMMINGPLNGSIARADSPRGRLPLHLQYRFDVPGKYEVRFVGTRMATDPGHGFRSVQVDESDWTEIEILPYSAAQRRKWLLDQVSKMPSSPGLLLGDAIPGLLAFPDALSLSATLPALYHSDDAVRRYAAASLTMFDDALLTKQLTQMIREKGPTEEIARILDGKEDLFEGGHQAFVAALPTFLHSPSPLVQAGALQYLVWEQNHDWGKTPEFQNQRSALVLNIALAVLEHSDAHLQQLLALALGSIKTDASRDLLWKMIESGTSEEQSRIAITWVGDSRDLPRLAGLLTRTDPADPYGRMSSSLPYSLHRAYGDASLPWLKQAARDAKQIFVRTSCAKELVLADQPEGFKYLLQAMGEMPTFKPEAMQFLRDRFPDLRDAPEGTVLAFLKGKAAAQ